MCVIIVIPHGARRTAHGARWHSEVVRRVAVSGVINLALALAWTMWFRVLDASSVRPRSEKPSAAGQGCDPTWRESDSSRGYGYERLLSSFWVTHLVSGSASYVFGRNDGISKFISRCYLEQCVCQCESLNKLTSHFELRNSNVSL